MTAALPLADPAPAGSPDPALAPRLVAVAGAGAPSRAVRLDQAPRPVLRRLGEVLEELRAARPVPGPLAADPGSPPARPPAPDPDRAAEEVRPLAGRVLGAVAEVLDGRRPVAHVTGLAAAEDAPRLAEHLAARRRTAGDARRAPAVRVSGLRLCGVGDGAVEVAAVVHGPTRSRAVCARFTRAGEARSGWRLRALVVL